MHPVTTQQQQQHLNDLKLMMMLKTSSINKQPTRSCGDARQPRIENFQC